MLHGLTTPSLHRAGAGPARGDVLAATVASSVASAQRRAAAHGQGPAVEIVHTVGCAERRGSDTEWWLVRAAEPETTQGGRVQRPRGGRWRRSGHWATTNSS